MAEMYGRAAFINRVYWDTAHHFGFANIVLAAIC